MARHAIYASTCSECSGRIRLGDVIEYDDDHEGPVHAQCVTTFDADDDPEPCPRCWLTICDCAGAG